MVMMRSILTFNLDNLGMESKKYTLIYCSSQSELLLENLVGYIYKKSENEIIEVDIVISEKEAKSSFILSLLQICPSLNAPESFCVMLLEPP